MIEKFIELEPPQPNQSNPVSWYVTESVGSPLCLTTFGIVQNIHAGDPDDFADTFWFDTEDDAINAMKGYYTRHNVPFLYTKNLVLGTFTNEGSRTMEFI